MFIYCYFTVRQIHYINFYCLRDLTILDKLELYYIFPMIFNFTIQAYDNILVPVQNVNFLYTHSHLSALQNCALI